jgi:hypothetical protein
VGHVFGGKARLDGVESAGCRVVRFPAAKVKLHNYEGEEYEFIGILEKRSWKENQQVNGAKVSMIRWSPDNSA